MWIACAVIPVTLSVFIACVSAQERVSRSDGGSFGGSPGLIPHHQSIDETNVSLKELLRQNLRTSDGHRGKPSLCIYSGLRASVTQFEYMWLSMCVCVFVRAFSCQRGKRSDRCALSLAVYHCTALCNTLVCSKRRIWLCA